MAGVVKPEERLLAGFGGDSPFEQEELMADEKRNYFFLLTNKWKSYPAIAKGENADIDVCGFSSSTAKYISNKSLSYSREMFKYQQTTPTTCWIAVHTSASSYNS